MSNSKTFSLVSALFVTTLIVSNIIATKIGSFGGHYLPVAVIVFPVAYILGDILTEIYGYAAVRRVIWIGFLCNFIAVIAIGIAINIPPAPFYQDNSAFIQVLGSTPRILIASFIGYLAGAFSNAFIMAKMKLMTRGRFLWLRTISSTLIGEGLDSAIFITVAFSGVFAGADLIPLMLTQWIFKVLFEIIATPLTYLVVTTLKKREGRDHFDYETNFNPLHF